MESCGHLLDERDRAKCENVAAADLFLKSNVKQAQFLDVWMNRWMDRLVGYMVGGWLHSQS